jgi:molybdopterin/thiamine biosynthesis adenylyltransferase
MPDSLTNATVLIGGAGNIGSYLVPLLARAGVGSIRLVDRDRVEPKNLLRQDYQAADVGRFKAEVQAERLQRQYPGQRFEPFCCDLEDLPLGLADVDVILGALDSRRARQVLISEMAWPLGVPVVDGGVGDNLLGRVQVFVPGADTACLECTWGKEDYRQLAAEYPCVPGAAAEGPPTTAPAFLGSLVASLMAGECLRLLGKETPTESYEVPFDLRHHQLRRFTLKRARACRHDHIVVQHALTLACGASVAELLATLESRFGPGPLQMTYRRCLGQGNPPGAARYLTVEFLKQHRSETLAKLGLVPGDHIRVRAGNDSLMIRMEGAQGLDS